jgi:ABC-type Mn2+/Zn2+ transport system permease subunit
MFLRRAVFLGVAVPQFSAAGLSLGLLILPWFAGPWGYFLDHSHPPTWYMFTFSAVAAGAALAAYAELEARQRRGSPDARLAAGFVVASALSLAFLSASPVGANLLESILRGGQILLLDRHGLYTAAAVFSAVIAGLWLFRRPMLLIAFDPETAVAFGLPVVRMERALLMLIGLAVAGGVMTAGPLLVFGLLFLPPLAARQAAGNMRAFLGHCVAVGLLAVLGAWPISLCFDQPYGPGAVLLGGLLVAGYFVAGRLRRPAQAA